MSEWVILENMLNTRCTPSIRHKIIITAGFTGFERVVPFPLVCIQPYQSIIGFYDISRKMRQIVFKELFRAFFHKLSDYVGIE